MRYLYEIYTIFIRYLYDVCLYDIYTKFIRYLYNIYLYDIYRMYIYTTVSIVCHF